MSKDNSKKSMLEIMAAKQGKTVGQMFADGAAPVIGVKEERLPAPVYFPDPDATPEEIRELIDSLDKDK